MRREVVRRSRAITAIQSWWIRQDAENSRVHRRVRTHCRDGDWDRRGGEVVGCCGGEGEGVGEALRYT